MGVVAFSHKRSLPPTIPPVCLHDVVLPTLKEGITHLSCTFILEAVMARAAVRLSLFGLLLAVVAALPIKVRRRAPHCMKCFSRCFI